MDMFYVHKYVNVATIVNTHPALGAGMERSAPPSEQR
jgi:hypothetical protein